jgi:DNA primase
MAAEWVDFKAVKAAVTMQMVLDRFGTKNLTKSGDELRGPCPIHKGSKGNKNFTVNIRKNAFKCFSESCGARGNVLDFVAAMENCSVRDAALKLQDWFGIGESQSLPEQSEKRPTVGAQVCRGIYQDESERHYEVIAIAAKRDDLQELVVYRELFGDFQFWVAPPETFAQESTSDQTDGLRSLTLIKTL